ncbi:MAG: SpoIIE family protein phosphatase, partial [Bacteroidota bacterium]|nr:SpoIIE family protein phosphatase [Bacteroidota bacterium]
IDEVSLAKKYAELSLELLGDEQFIELKANSFGVLSMVYEELNKNEIALTYKESEQVLNDSLYSLVNKEALAEAEIKYEYDKKAFSDSLVNIQKQRVFDASLEVKNAELKSQNRITNGIIFILFLIVVFSIILWLRFQKNQQEKELIKEQKNVMDDAYTELEENKIEIEKKNKEIIDSIYYARYIQRALYPDEDHMKAFFEDYVVFNLPKDIVGGDFHWFKSFGDKAIAIAADCTGHGVPGGFITVLGNLFIESSTGDHPKSPDEILSDINNELVTVLKQHEKDAIQDGMDLGICLIDKKTRKITFSGSRNGVYVVNKKGDLKEIKGDYTPVGGFYSKKEKINNRKYETHEIKLKKDEWLFMYSDGYYDQFGGDRNKSMGSTRFKDILVSAVKNEKLQTSDFKNYFFNWMGENEQLDDVLLMGFTL